MASQSSYPLEQVALIKNKKRDEAERVLAECKQQLEKEKEKLLAVEKERDDVKIHRHHKLTQIREHMDTGGPPHKLQQMRAYLKIVDEKLKIKEQKVTEQKKVVHDAEAKVTAARADLLKRQQEVEKLDLHKKEWTQEQNLAAQRQEGVEADETGALLHQHRKRKQK